MSNGGGGCASGSSKWTDCDEGVRARVNAILFDCKSKSPRKKRWQPSSRRSRRCKATPRHLPSATPKGHRRRPCPRMLAPLRKFWSGVRTFAGF
jgi:hypothetical protein